MAENKRQHYVPKWTLRYFASDPERWPRSRQINIVNISKYKVIRGASLGDQCYRDYFYGKDLVIERALCEIESKFSDLVRKIINDRSIDNRDGWHLVQMVALQRARTLRAEEELNSMIDPLIKLFLYNKADEEDLRQVRIKVKEAANRNVAYALALSPLILDLKRFLIVNETSVPFVIADNPVVFTNWFGRKYDARRAIGLARSGLQVFQPLTPHLALLMHDSNVYTTESRGSVISISRIGEITALNELQWLNAYKNVYFPPNLPEQFLNEMKLIRRPEGALSEFRRLERKGEEDSYCETDKDEFSPPSDGVRSELVVQSAKGLPKDVRLRAIRIRSRPLFHDDGSLASPQRDPAWGGIVGDFARQATKGMASVSSFWDFVARHPLEPHIGPWLRKAKRRADRQRQ